MKIIFAIDAAPSAMPVNPKIAATIAITRKIAVHLSMIFVFLDYWLFIVMIMIYFLPARIIRSTITITTAITIKIPNSIPALNIPAMALHELSNMGIKFINNSLR